MGERDTHKISLITIIQQKQGQKQDITTFLKHKQNTKRQRKMNKTKQNKATNTLTQTQ